MNTAILEDEKQQLADSVRRYVERGYGDSMRSASERHPDGCDPQRWKEFADLGWLALPLSEGDGGLGGSLADTCASWASRRVLPGAVSSAMTGSDVIAGSSSARTPGWLPSASYALASSAASTFMWRCFPWRAASSVFELSPRFVSRYKSIAHLSGVRNMSLDSAKFSRQPEELHDRARVHAVLATSDVLSEL